MSGSPDLLVYILSIQLYNFVLLFSASPAALNLPLDTGHSVPIKNFEDSECISGFSKHFSTMNMTKDRDVRANLHFAIYIVSELLQGQVRD